MTYPKIRSTRRRKEIASYLRMRRGMLHYIKVIQDRLRPDTLDYTHKQIVAQDSARDLATEIRGMRLLLREMFW